MTFGVAFGVARGVAFGVAVGVAVGVGFMIGYYRLLFYLFQFPFQIGLYGMIKLKPDSSIKFIQKSPIFWDEMIWFPLPFLSQMLRQGFHQDETIGLAFIQHVSVSFRQKKAAMSAIAWITSDLLTSGHSIQDMIQQLDRLQWLPENLSDLDKDVGEILPHLQAIGNNLKSTPMTDIYSLRLTLRNSLESLNLLDDRIKILGQLAVARWSNVIQHWHHVFSNELMPLDQFKPSQSENPYQVGNPLTCQRKDLFKGRIALRDAIVHALKQGNRPTLVLHGPRRMGKTSFLLQLPALLPGHTIPVFTNLQNSAITGSHADFLYAIARAMSQSASPYRIQIPGPIKDRFIASPFSAFDEWLEDEAIPCLSDFNVLITMDEFEKLGEAIAKKRMDETILDYIRHMIQHQQKLAFLFSGVRTMDDLGPQWSSYFINIKPLSMDYLKPDEARELIIAPDRSADFTITYEPEVIDAILFQTHCQPYLVQLVCSAIVETANIQNKHHIDSKLFQTSLLLALEQGELYFRNVWDEMAGPQAQALLKTIASKDITLIPNPTKQDSIALKHMLKNKVITQKNDGYCIEIPLVKQWLEAYE